MPEEPDCPSETAIAYRPRFLTRIVVWNSRLCRVRFPPIRILRDLLWAFFGSDIAIPLCNTVVIPHPHGIFINKGVRLGKGCVIMQHVTIGSDHRRLGVGACIGDRVFIGAGAKVIGGITIGDDAVIGANAVVTRDVPPKAVVVGANRILTS